MALSHMPRELLCEVIQVDELESLLLSLLLSMELRFQDLGLWFLGSLEWPSKQCINKGLFVGSGVLTLSHLTCLYISCRVSVQTEFYK